MLEAILTGSTNNSDCVKAIPDLSSIKQKDDYKVDQSSISTYNSDGDSYAEDDGVVVAPEEQLPPHFESVSIVNSNDVHFGNKTIYKGPVTIKQFLYPNSDSDLILTNVRSEPDIIGNGVSLGTKQLCAYENPALVRTECVVDKDVIVTPNETKLESSKEDDIEEISPLRRGLIWLKNIQNWKRSKLLVVSVVLLTLLLLSSFILWRYLDDPKNLVKTAIQGYVSEEDKNTPVDYDPDTTTINAKVRLVKRLSWLAQPPMGPISPLKLPVPLVIIQHTATENCTSQAQCIFLTRHIQTFHIESYGWNDIGYNFLVGGDGDAYEGRGWTNEGAHTFGYNNRSIGIAFIGTFNTELPPPAQINAFNKMVAIGVDSGYISKHYKIIAARQLSSTESPGKVFFELIKKWPHWSEKP